ncbi:SNARE associated Golgi protein family [Striga asiatica]|uniref:SNARE associated Golgi protein family n=1 Tax=Striga asiatica TaxID=4170 RepID=A0A5A7Q0M4_STRAF|nr:SNARE associated Golgi protein family [Striga asiatica]
MAAPRSVVVDAGSRLSDRDEEKDDESPSGKKLKAERFPLSRWEFAAALGVFLVFSTGLLCVYLTMPAAEYEMLKLPRNLSDLRSLKDKNIVLWILELRIGVEEYNIRSKLYSSNLFALFNICSRDHLATYAQVYPAKFILGYCSTYIFMQTFMIPGTIFMSLLAGALFGVVRGIFLVVFNATAGASSCYFLSKLIGRPIVNWLWPEKLRFFQAEAGLALGELKSVKDLYDFKTLMVLFLIGSILLLPTVLKRKRIYE